MKKQFQKNIGQKAKSNNYSKIMNKFTMFFFGSQLCLSPMISIAAEASTDSNYTVSPQLGRTGHIVFLTKSGDSWTASNNGDESKNGVEIISIDLADKTIYVNAFPPTNVTEYERKRGPGKDNRWECFSGLLSNHSRNSHGYSICASALTKNVSNGFEAVIGSLNLLVGTARTYVAIDPAKVLAAVNSSGAIKIAEQELADEQLSNYRNAYSLATTSRQLNSFIERYKNNDPDELVSQAEKKLTELEAQDKANNQNAFTTLSESESIPAENWQKAMIGAWASSALEEFRTGLIQYNGSYYSGKAFQVEEHLDSEGIGLLPDDRGHYVGSQHFTYGFGLSLSQQVNGYTVPKGVVLEEKITILAPVPNLTISDLMKSEIETLYRISQPQAGFYDSCKAMTQQLVMNDTTASFACTNDRFSFTYIGIVDNNEAFIKKTKIARGN